MIGSFIALFAEPGFPWAAALVLKVTVLLTAAAALAALLRHRSAEARYLVWTLGIAGTLALTLITPIAPGVAISVITLPSAPVITTGGTVPRSTDNSLTNVSAQTIGASRESTVSSGNSEARWIAKLADVPSTTIVAWLWLIGCAGVFFRILLGHVGLARLARTAIPAKGDEWSALLGEAVRRNGVARPVRLGLSAAAGGPVTWGWSRPVVLLPVDAASWPRERRRAALVHELAHIARCDYLTRLASSIACGVFWFHPLVWLAAHRLRIESEHACDDLVLSSGTAPPDYAVHLLNVARHSRELRLSGFVAVSMARPSHLEGRLLAVLDATRPRRRVALRTRLLATAALGVTLVPFAGLRPELRAASPSPQPVVDGTPRVTSVVSRQPEAAIARQGSPKATTEATVEAAPLISGVSAASPDSCLMNEVKVAPGEILLLDLETGGTVDIRGADEQRVTVCVRLAGRDWEDTRVVVERMEGGVRVTSAQDRETSSYSTSHSFVITVPKRFDVKLTSGGGAVTIIGVEGSFRGQTGGGELTLERLSGQANLSTGGGDIAVSDSDLRGSVSTGGGMVSFSKVRGGLRASSGSGPVIYAEASDEENKGDLKGVTVGKSGKIEDLRLRPTGVLHVRKAGGDVEIAQAPEGANISTGGGRIRVGRAARLVDATTGGGNIEIGPVAGSVRAETGAGDVRITLVNAKGEEQSVEVTSGSGRVVLELPPTLDARIDLETAFTRRFGRAAIIESAWDLERDEITGWDSNQAEWESNQGTPRRYVRARGLVGSGRGLIRIRTVNGDIVLRRGSP
ncbi:MAG: M56 family metallopeptidase [Gemmatimonadaceae bacterium]